MFEIKIFEIDSGSYTWLHVFVGILAFSITVWIGIKEDIDWIWLSLWGGLTICLSPWTSSAVQFFRAGISNKDTSTKSFFLISISTFIAWVFAKSVYNASTLGGKYGMMGGAAYASWYTSFLCVAFTVYRIRKKGYKSLPDAIHQRYGSLACITYCLVVLYRLEQEVWSNALVVAGFYGKKHEYGWWLAAIVTTAIPMVYILMSGLKSSIYTDVVQAIVALIFLFSICIAIAVKQEDLDCPFDNKECDVMSWNPVPGRNVFSLQGGMDLLIVGLLQGSLSYGFFDPVLTDRAFLLEPKTMFYSYILGGFLAACFIFFFSMIGVYGNMAATLDPTGAIEGMSAGQPAATTEYMGSAWNSIVNIIFITSSISTVDSTFSSTAKLVGPELYEFIKNGRPLGLHQTNDKHIILGRCAIIFMAIVGIAPLINKNITALSATTSTGTLLMGMGPPILFLADLEGYRPLCFHIPFWCSACIGIAYMFTSSNNEYNTARWVDLGHLAIGEGSYAILLGVNVLSACLSMGTFWIFALENRTGEDIERHRLIEGPGFQRTVEMINKWNETGSIELVHVTKEDEERLAMIDKEVEENETGIKTKSPQEEKGCFLGIVWN